MLIRFIAVYFSFSTFGSIYLRIYVLSLILGTPPLFQYSAPPLAVVNTPKYRTYTYHTLYGVRAVIVLGNISYKPLSYSSPCAINSRIHCICFTREQTHLLLLISIYVIYKITWINRRVFTLYKTVFHFITLLFNFDKKKTYSQEKRECLPSGGKEWPKQNI